MKKWLVVLTAALGLIAALSALKFAEPAAGSVTLGQLGPSADLATVSSAAEDRLQPTVTSGNGYVVPSTGGVTAWTVTSWSTNADVDSVEMGMKIFRKLADPATYTVVGHDGPRLLTPGVVNTFPASIAVKAGDVLGVGYPDTYSGGSNFAPCCFLVSGEHFLSREGYLGDGQSGDFSLLSGLRINVTAVLDPTNTFTVGGIKRKDNGTAVVTASVPNAGDLTASGKGVKSAAARTAKSVAAGTAKLKIKAKGKQLRKLDSTGKVTLKTTITYTPTGGNPSSRKIKVKLRKR